MALFIPHALDLGTCPSLCLECPSLPWFSYPFSHRAFQDCFLSGTSTLFLAWIIICKNYPHRPSGSQKSLPETFPGGKSDVGGQGCIPGQGSGAGKLTSSAHPPSSMEGCFPSLTSDLSHFRAVTPSCLPPVSMDLPSLCWRAFCTLF